MSLVFKSLNPIIVTIELSTKKMKRKSILIATTRALKVLYEKACMVEQMGWRDSPIDIKVPEYKSTVSLCGRSEINRWEARVVR